MRILRLGVVLLVVGACGGAAGPTTSSEAVGTSVVTTLVGTSVVTTAPATGTTVLVTTTLAPGALPPHLYADLEPLLAPLVAPLGFVVTRASLVELGTYENSPEGTHLAVYVEPDEEHTPDQVATLTTRLAAALLPEVFDRWSGLESFDVCQEPYAPGDGATPPTDTLLDVSREVALGIDWDTVTLAELIAAAGPGLRLYAAEHIRASDTWSAAEAAAG